MSNTVILATKTLEAIERVIHADQGASYRGHLGEVIPTMSDAYRNTNEGFRSHLGASMIGGECGRAIWYGFHWATKSNFSGRLLRLFNRGHLEEARFIAMLQAIGATIYQQDTNGKQYRISGAAGHYGGSGDGIAVNLPDLPAGMPALCEFKTHNDASFKKLLSGGVRDSKFEHYVQMNQYMHKMRIPAALYLAVNKNNDELYGEILHYDQANAEQFSERAERIVWLSEPPSKLGNPPSPGNFGCRFCDHKPVCHLKAAPAKNCRTCEWSEPVNTGNGVWVCNHPGLPLEHRNITAIPKEVQETACQGYAIKRNF
jgi:hypothetical protein